MITIHAEGRAQPQKGPKKTFGLFQYRDKLHQLKMGGGKLNENQQILGNEDSLTSGLLLDSNVQFSRKITKYTQETKEIWTNYRKKINQ